MNSHGSDDESFLGKHGIRQSKLQQKASFIAANLKRHLFVFFGSQPVSNLSISNGLYISMHAFLCRAERFALMVHNAFFFDDLSPTEEPLFHLAHHHFVITCPINPYHHLYDLRSEEFYFWDSELFWRDPSSPRSIRKPHDDWIEIPE